MRRLGLLLLPILVLVFPAAATAAWQGGSPWTYASYFPDPDHFGFDRFNTGLLFAEHFDAPGSGVFRNSLDGGASWENSGALTAGGKNFEVAVDGDGNRIWAYSVANTIAVTRAAWTDGPGNPTTTRYFSVPGVTDLEIAANPNGDVLISWSDENGDPGVAFWQQGDSAPGPIQILTNADTCASSSTPTPFLDPSGSATLAWTCDDEEVDQASSIDASIPGSFGESERLALGTIVREGQAPDGRAVILFQRTEESPENPSGAESVRLLKYATRLSGSSFGNVGVLAGGGERDVRGVADRIVVAPNGRVLTGFTTFSNNPAFQYFCDPDGTAPATPASFMAEGTIDASTGELTFTKSQLSPPGVTDAWVTHVAVGLDGRLALAHGSTTFCGVDLRPTARERVLLSLDGHSFEEIPNPYFHIWSFQVFTFTAKGQLFITARHALFGPPHADFYDTNAPLEPAVRPGQTKATGTGTGTGTVDSTSTAPTVVKSSIRIAAVKTLKGGKLAVTLESNTTGTFSVIAKSGRTVVGKSTAKSKSGTTKLQIKLYAKAAKQLKKTGRLKAKLTTTLAPTSGVAPAPVTKSVTFRK